MAERSDYYIRIEGSADREQIQRVADYARGLGLAASVMPESLPTDSSAESAGETAPVLWVGLEELIDYENESGNYKHEAHTAIRAWNRLYVNSRPDTLTYRLPKESRNGVVWPIPTDGLDFYSLESVIRKIDEAIDRGVAQESAINRYFTMQVGPGLIGFLRAYVNAKRAKLQTAKGE